MENTPQPTEEQPPVLPVALREARKKAAAVNLGGIVKAIAQSGTTRLSKMIGMNGTYLSRKTVTGDVPVSLLVCLSWAVHRNMFDIYLQLLPEDCRETALTRELRKEIEELKGQIETEKKETEKWKEKFEYADGVLRGRSQG